MLVGVRGSPPDKVGTLSRDSLLLLHHVRCELDRRRAASGEPLEVCAPEPCALTEP